MEQLFRDPEWLRGRSPEEVLQLVELPNGWKLETLRRGSQKGRGLVLREYGRSGDPTGRLIRWHPGGGHHGGRAYWRVASPENGLSGLIR